MNNSESSVGQQKTLQTISKYLSLLQQNKAYEFAQKIKSLAQRKMQTNKYQQAESLLYYGSQALLNHSTSELNSANQLIKILIELYQKQKSLVNQQTAKKMYDLLNIKPDNPQKLPFFLKIIKSITQIQNSLQICEDLIEHYQSNRQFWKIQPLVVHLGMTRITKFLQKWKQNVDDQEYTIIACRMALLFGALYTFDQSMVILSELTAANPFVKYARFMIQSVQMKSLEAYNKIGSSYKTFIQSDAFYSKMYDLYGNKFFKIDKKQASGLFSLMSSLE